MRNKKSDLAILAINTLQNDCRDDNAMVRGLALRSLSSLSIDSLTEYCMMPIRKGLNDASPYVRKTAVLACAKLHRHAPDVVKESFVDVLYDMLRDKDTSVIVNAISSLDEILLNEGRTVVSAQIVIYLLKRIKEFGEWGQCVILDYVSRYTPQNEGEMFDIMNLLEDRLKHSNSAVVIATTNVFLNFTKNAPDVHEQVYKRLKAPLLTLMSGSVELSFTVLSHIQVLTDRAPQIFADSFKHFFCRFNDPSCVKQIKLDILTMLANDKNMTDIMAEFSEYVTDVNIDIARASVKGIGKIAIQIDAAADEAIEHLLSFLDLDTDYISAEAVIVMKDILRKYPERYEEVIAALNKCLKSIDEPDGKVAVIWMIGEYGDTIDDAPYILRALIDGVEDEPSHAVRMELLTAAMKLFFKRPPEMQAMLGSLLKICIDDVSKVDVRDRALLYYRLLQLDVHEAARVVNCPKQIVSTFVEVQDQDLKDKIFAEFNTLSVIYGTPEERFTKYKPDDEEDEEDEGEESPEQEHAPQDVHQRTTTAPPTQTPTQSQQTRMAQPKPSPEPTPPSSEFDLLGMNDSPNMDSVSSEPSLAFIPKPSLDAPTFQNKWGSLPVSSEEQLQIADLSKAAFIEGNAQKAHIHAMAVGTVKKVMKLYLYAQDGSRSLYLWECRANLSSGRFIVRLKTDTQNPKNPALANGLFKNALRDIIV